MMVFNTNDRYVGRSFDLYGEYSEGEVDMFRRLIKPEDTVVDVGANIGALTVPMSRMANKVIAFEPQHAMYYVLCANVAINNLTNVDCWLMAVSKERGSIDVPVIDIATKGNYGSLALNHEYEGEVITKAVPMVTLDSATLDKCGFIKIDVEGMEVDVLKGATETIKNNRPILCIEDDRPDQREELYELIWSLDYRIIGHRPLLYNANNFSSCKHNEFVDDEGKPFASYNLICLPNEDVVHYRELVSLGLPSIKEITRGLRTDDQESL